jgi:hypothetical protein
MLLVLRPRYDLKEAQLFQSVWFDGNSMFFVQNMYFLMISNMLVTHSLLFGFNSVLALLLISVWYFRAVIPGWVSI